MSGALPVAAAILATSRRISARAGRGAAARDGAWDLLRRMLLGADGAAVCGRCDECVVDRADRRACAGGESDSGRPRSSKAIGSGAGFGGGLDDSARVTERALE